MQHHPQLLVVDGRGAVFGGGGVVGPGAAHPQAALPLHHHHQHMHGLQQPHPQPHLHPHLHQLHHPQHLQYQGPLQPQPQTQQAGLHSALPSLGLGSHSIGELPPLLGGRSSLPTATSEIAALLAQQSLDINGLSSHNSLSNNPAELSQLLLRSYSIEAGAPLLSSNLSGILGAHSLSLTLPQHSSILALGSQQQQYQQQQQQQQPQQEPHQPAHLQQPQRLSPLAPQHSLNNSLEFCPSILQTSLPGSVAVGDEPPRLSTLLTRPSITSSERRQQQDRPNEAQDSDRAHSQQPHSIAHTPSVVDLFVPKHSGSSAGGGSGAADVPPTLFAHPSVNNVSGGAVLVCGEWDTCWVLQTPPCAWLLTTWNTLQAGCASVSLAAYNSAQTSPGAQTSSRAWRFCECRPFEVSVESAQ
eukprot:1158879-Pelagomonas_calceolata.AAC.4